MQPAIIGELAQVFEDCLRTYTATDVDGAQSVANVLAVLGV